MNQLCIRHGGEQYLPRALVELNHKVDGISRRLGHHHHHSGGGSSVLPSDEGERIIELIGGEGDRTSVTDKLKILARSVTDKFEILASAALHTHREVRQIKDDTAVLGKFENPHHTVAGHLSAIGKAFGKVVSHDHVDALTRAILELKAENAQLKAGMNRMEGMLAHIVRALHARSHSESGSESGSESDSSSHP